MIGSVGASQALRRVRALSEAAAEMAPGIGWAGLPGDALAHAIATAAAAWSRVLVVLDGSDRAERLVRGLRFFGPELVVLPFPADDHRPYDGFSPDPELAVARLLALARVQSPRPVVVVAAVRALQQRMPTRAVREFGTTQLVPGLVVDRDELVRSLGASGYLVAAHADAPGRVTVRGDVLHVWPVGQPGPVRADFFDDEIEALQRLDPVTGAVVARMKRATIPPAREERIDANSLIRLAETLGREVVSQNRGVKLRRAVIEDLSAGVRFGGLDAWLPALVEVAPPLEMLTDLRVIVVHPDAVAAAARDFERLAVRRWNEVDEADRPLIPPSQRYVPADEVVLSLAGGLPVWSVAAEGPCVDFRAVPPDAFSVRGGDLAPVLARLSALAEDGVALGLVVENARRADQLTALLAPHGITPTPRSGPRDVGRGEVAVVIGDLPGGFVAPESLLAFIPVAALFGARTAARTERRTVLDHGITDVSRLKVGDRVVHRLHGVGEYRGLQRLPVEQAEQDFARVAYRDGDLLFVPVHALDQLAPWAGGDAENTPLDRLGGVSWAARKGKVRDKLLSAADEIVRLYARRAAAERDFRPPPGRLYRAVEASFPYEETPDQLEAIEAVLADLGSPHAMDRLLCGDVGFGKTEVALRAMARVVECGGQVAVLCPTTVLVHQHVRSFRERLANHGVKVAHLSRFLGPAEERAVRSGLADGSIDVVVGTVALLSRETRFARLELWVVDEEHRFGVKQKDKLRRLRDAMDVLAMSATPIPRTLQMTLTGVLDVSVIHTPPRDRLAVRTVVAPLTPGRLRDVIEPELARGGQAFVIHNRIASLSEFANWVRETVPDARVGVAHGQMDPHKLEDVLVRFVERSLDVLVCTSIVESGVDLPNVNTLVVDGADAFGLGQLHQLRGRVGRGAVRATALFGVPEVMSSDARRRLRVLEENTELGAGFRIAAADLELRGGGNLLGVDQSGQIAEVGWETFVQLLEEAVQHAKGNSDVERLEPIVEVPVPAFLPDALVPDVTERLAWYRRLSAAGSDAGVETVLDELEAEVGPLPDVARNLGGLVATRIRCRELGIARCQWLKVRLILELHPSSRLVGAIAEVLLAHPKRFAQRPGPPVQVEVRFTPKEAEHPFRLVRWALARLSEAVPSAPKRVASP